MVVRVYILGLLGLRCETKRMTTCLLKLQSKVLRSHSGLCFAQIDQKDYILDFCFVSRFATGITGNTLSFAPCQADSVPCAKRVLTGAVARCDKPR